MALELLEALASLGKLDNLASQEQPVRLVTLGLKDLQEKLDLLGISLQVSLLQKHFYELKWQIFCLENDRRLCENASCEHSCKIDMCSETKYICTCNDGWKLASDGISCTGKVVSMNQLASESCIKFYFSTQT